MLTEQERAALERVRSDVDWKDSVPARQPEQILDDAQSLVDAMLRLYPADDDEPITSEWNRENWPEPLSARGITISDYCGSPQWTIDIYVEADEYSGDGQSFWIANVATRGDARAFLRGMGIDMKGGGA